LFIFAARYEPLGRLPIGPSDNDPESARRILMSYMGEMGKSIQRRFRPPSIGAPRHLSFFDVRKGFGGTDWLIHCTRFFLWLSRYTGGNYPSITLAEFLGGGCDNSSRCFFA
jgi:hypothetical protein